MGVVGTLYVCSCSTFLCMSTAHIPPSSFLFFAPSLTSFFPPSSLLSLPFLPSPSSPLLTSSFPLSLSLSLSLSFHLPPSLLQWHPQWYYDCAFSGADVYPVSHNLFSSSYDSEQHRSVSEDILYNYHHPPVSVQVHINTYTYTQVYRHVNVPYSGKFLPLKKYFGSCLGGEN